MFIPESRVTRSFTFRERDSLDSGAGYDGGSMVSSFVDAVSETPISNGF